MLQSPDGKPELAVHAIDHPLVNHHLADLRSVSTDHREFRRLIHNLSTLLVFEGTKKLGLGERSIETPLCSMVGQELSESISLVPVLRAGLGMCDAFLDLIPCAQVWHLGFYRDEQTATPVKYYDNLPSGCATDVAFILDPMLATGGSTAAVYQRLVDWGVKRIQAFSIIAAPEGLNALEKEFPDLELMVCAIDERLNDAKFIVPGLGDAGDRIFNTESGG